MSGLIEALKSLLASENGVNASAFSVSQRKVLEQFAQQTRLIEIRKHGRSTIFRCLNFQGVADFLAMQQPLETVPKNIPVRSQNIGLQRNSKKGQSTHETSYLLMKCWHESAFWKNGEITFYPEKLTREFGVAALQIQANQGWLSHCPLLLVENLALFNCPNWLPENFDGCLIYYAGQLSDVVLRWFAEQKRTEKVILFPDYDGVGLSNYVRLARALRDESKLEFFWLPNWEQKLLTFGNAEIWQNTRGQFENALKNLAKMNLLTADFVKLGDLSQRHARTLEQEAIWL